MRILIRHVEGASERRELRKIAMKEIGAVTRRLRWLLPRITLVLSRSEAAAGEADKRCVIEMTSRRTGSVVATALARDWIDAVTGALRLAGRRLSEASHALALLPRQRRTLTLQRVRAR